MREPRCADAAAARAGDQPRSVGGAERGRGRAGGWGDGGSWLWLLLASLCLVLSVPLHLLVRSVPPCSGDGPPLGVPTAAPTSHTPCTPCTPTPRPLQANHDLLLCMAAQRADGDSVPAPHAVAPVDLPSLAQLLPPNKVSTPSHAHPPTHLPASRRRCLPCVPVRAALGSAPRSCCLGCLSSLVRAGRAAGEGRPRSSSCRSVCLPHPIPTSTSHLHPLCPLFSLQLAELIRLNQELEGAVHEAAACNAAVAAVAQVLAAKQAAALHAREAAVGATKRLRRFMTVLDTQVRAGGQYPGHQLAGAKGGGVWGAVGCVQG